jgi:3-deoxy-manno-octulosonate cytidylyltransferase (CMP-KDO synthetase)
MSQGRVVGVVPARLESTRFPGKVLAPVLGEPLVRHTFERLRESAAVGEAIVATDSHEVRDAVEAFGGRVVMVTEPCACGSDRVAAAVTDVDADVVVNLQADQPLISPEDIDRAVEALRDDDGLDISTLAFETDDPSGFVSPDVVKVVTGRAGRALYFSRAPVPAEGPGGGGNPLYLHHVGIYCFRREALERFASMPHGELEIRESLEQLRALEYGMTMGVVRTERRTLSVDRAEDIPEVERLLASP